MNATLRPVLLAPTGDPTPVEQAAADSIADAHDPETFLWLVFHRPGGGARVWHAWTVGGQPLGDRIDQLALAASLDASDWLDIADQHCTHSTRGRIAVQAYPLRPVLADVQAGIRGPQERRDALRRVITCAADMTGRTPHTTTPGWLGFGPALVAGGAR